jgi:alpha-galactosidase
MSNAKPNADFISLHGSNVSLVIELCPTHAPIWRYWGPILTSDALPPNSLEFERAVPTFSLDKNVPFTIFPTFGAGWYGAPALLAHRAGFDFAQNFSSSSWRWLSVDTSVEFTLTDDVAKIMIVITLQLDATNDVLSYQSTLKNIGEGPLTISSMAAACLPVPAAMSRVRAYTGRHNHEFECIDNRLSRATWLRENRRGLTSHDCLPAALIFGERTSNHSGPAYGAQLAWSGNHFQRIDSMDDGSYQWQLGEWLAPGEVILDKDDIYETPQVLATFSPLGLDGIAQNFHATMRQRITWPGGKMKPRPVHLNTWEGLYFDLDEAALFTMAEQAAAIGVERFILDDGWFASRRNDKAGLGDWWVDTGIFPNGLVPLASHVTKLGMEFGLWVEPEMVNPDSDLYRAHPDWALQIGGRSQLTARNQLVLDVSNPAVFHYLLEKIGDLLSSLPISYLKWDHNRDVTLAGHSGRAAYRRQIQASYRLFDAVRKNWPAIEIEACAGGGGRIDAGILPYVHRFWTSDCIDAVSRVAIERGFLQFFPPELMGSHIGTSPAHSTGRRQAMDFRASVAFGGHLGIELDPRHLSDVHRDKLSFWINAYKEHRHILHGGQVWNGACDAQTSWRAQGTRDDFIVSVFKFAPTGQRFEPKLLLYFVDTNETYHVGLIAPAPKHSPSRHQASDYMAETMQINGAWLANSGLQLPPLKGEDGLILRFTKASK